MVGVQTLRTPVTVEGVGLHTGATARVEVRPAVAGSGRVFLREGVAIPALADYVVDTRRCTTLGAGTARVSTVEHLLAALLLADIDDAEIAVDGPELPALDGAAAQWLATLREAGTVAQPGELPVVRIDAPRWLAFGGAEVFLTPGPGLALYAAVDVPETVVQRMLAGGRVDDPAVAAQIARARTYGLEREVQALLDAGLARGGSLENAVVLTATGYLNDHVWPDEPAWHKVLDLLGDLALVGARIEGHILAVRAGHAAHVGLAQTLIQAYRS